MASNKIMHGILFIISAPSGAGKTTLVHSLVESTPDLYVSISHTTRPRRGFEKDGIDYHFVDEQTFSQLIEQGQFLEHAKVFDHYYGTSRKWVEEQLAAGKDIILEIDWQGAQQVSSLMPNTVSIFILPPSYKSLESRLYDRGDDDETVQRRMRDARDEISHYAEYKFLVVNDDFTKALSELMTIVKAMRHGYWQQMEYFDNFVSELLQDQANIS